LKSEGYIHKSQGNLLHSYIVSSRDGYANVRTERQDQDNAGTRIQTGQLRTGTRVWVLPEWNEGDWLYIAKPMDGFIHKSQLRRAD